VLWVGTLGADRVDLLAGAGPFLLKPLLVLLPPILILELLRLGRRERPLLMPPGAALFFVGHTALLSLLLLSVMYSQEVGLGVQRFALLAVESYACFLIVIALVNRPDSRAILLRGAWLGLLLILVFDLIQVSRWVGGPALDGLSLAGMIELDPATYGPWLPRPSGVSVDPNRGGLLLIFYLFLLMAFGSVSRLRAAAIITGSLLLLVTLSRSAILAAIVVAAVWVLRRRARISRAGIGGTSIALATAAAALLVSPVLQQVLQDLMEIIAQRASLGEGSSSVHLTLLARGWEISTNSVRNALLGIGFGNSFLVLHEFFPGTKYGNFHSAYMSLLVEAGVGAVVLFFVLVLRPLLRGSSFAPLIAGMLAFNVFYQAHVEAIFWFILALAWMIPDRSAAPESPRALVNPARLQGARETVGLVSPQVNVG
jgi:hypothetical protein